MRSTRRASARRCSLLNHLPSEAAARAENASELILSLFECCPVYKDAPLDGLLRVQN